MLLNIPRCTVRISHLRCPWCCQAQQGRERLWAGTCPGQLTTCGHLSLPARPKPWREVGIRGCMGSGAPSGILHPASSCSCARWPSCPAYLRDRCSRAAPRRPPGSLPSSGGPMGLSTGTKSSTCPHLTSGSPSHCPRMYHPHPALGFLCVPWAVTCQASSLLQGALPKLTLRAPPCSVTLMGRFSMLGVPGRAACSTPRQLGDGEGRDPSPKLDTSC